MKLTDKQKDLIRKELSGEEDSLLWIIKQDVDKLHPLALDEEDIETLRRFEEWFRTPDYVVVDRDPEVDDYILDFEKEVLWVWGSIRRHVIPYKWDDQYDIDFDKDAILKDIDYAVNNYLKKLEEK